MTREQARKQGVLAAPAEADDPRTRQYHARLKRCETYTVLLQSLLLLLLPHLHDRLQIRVVAPRPLKVVESLHQDLSHARVLGTPKQGLCRVDNLLVHVSRKSLARVIGQDADKHDGVVLPRGARREFLVQVLSNEAGAFGGCGRGRLGGLDDWGEEEDIVALYTQRSALCLNDLCSSHRQHLRQVALTELLPPASINAF